MDEVDVLLAKLQLAATELTPALFNNSEHKIGIDRFVLQERGLILYLNDIFYSRVLILTLSNESLAVSIAKNHDGVIFYDHIEYIDLFSPDFMTKATTAIKFCQAQLLSFYDTDQTFNDRMNSIVKSR